MRVALVIFHWLTRRKIQENRGQAILWCSLSLLAVRDHISGFGNEPGEEAAVAREVAKERREVTRIAQDFRELRAQFGDELGLIRAVSECAIAV